MTKAEALDILANEKLMYLNLRRKHMAMRAVYEHSNPAVSIEARAEESLYRIDGIIAALDIAIIELQKGDTK